MKIRLSDYPGQVVELHGADADAAIAAGGVELVPLRLRVPWDLYNAGEVAGFKRELADRLIEADIAYPPEDTAHA